MDELLFDRITRRVVLGGVTGMVLSHVVGFVEATAKKQHKRKRRKRKRHKEPKATCAQNCSAPCNNCFHRPVGPPLCGGGANGSCFLPCLSDSDCVGTGRPYCLTGYTNRLTNEFQPIDCPQGHPRICYDVFECG